MPLLLWVVCPRLWHYQRVDRDLGRDPQLRVASSRRASQVHSVVNEQSHGPFPPIIIIIIIIIITIIIIAIIIAIIIIIIIIAGISIISPSSSSS